jgi:hypothetical protein
MFIFLEYFLSCLSRAFNDNTVRLMLFLSEKLEDKFAVFNYKIGCFFNDL